MLRLPGTRHGPKPVTGARAQCDTQTRERSSGGQMRTRVFAVLLIAVFTWTCSTSVHALPSDEAIREILRHRVDVARQATGIVVGIVDATGRRVITHGTLSAC